MTNGVLHDEAEQERKTEPLSLDSTAKVGVASR